MYSCRSWTAMSSSDSFVSIRRRERLGWCFIQRTTVSAKRGLSRCPAVSILTKPVEPEEVLKVVERVLSDDVRETPPDVPPLPTEFDREHLRLLTDKLSDNARDPKAANARLRALINIGGRSLRQTSRSRPHRDAMR